MHAVIMETDIMGQIQSIINPFPPRPTKKPNYDIIVKLSHHSKTKSDFKSGFNRRRQCANYCVWVYNTTKTTDFG